MLVAKYVFSVSLLSLFPLLPCRRRGPGRGGAPRSEARTPPSPRSSLAGRGRNSANTLNKLRGETQPSLAGEDACATTDTFNRIRNRHSPCVASPAVPI